MHYGEIKKIDIANGEGVRVSLFVSGCRVNCPGCFNKVTWDFCYGKEFTKETEEELIAALSLDFITGLTVLGGEPFEEENQAVLSEFLSRVKKEFPDKTIWCYTGYVYDKDILPQDGKKHTEYTQKMLDNINVLVDGPFVEELKDVSLKFRGSRNQRILKLN